MTDGSVLERLKVGLPIDLYVGGTKKITGTFEIIEVDKDEVTFSVRREIHEEISEWRFGFDDGFCYRLYNGLSREQCFEEGMKVYTFVVN